MRPFDVQVMGGWILLNGMVAEMDTGEGKTLTATLPSATVALAGLPVHVVTVNDYLARRDASLMRPLYRALGLSVGIVTSGMSTAARRQAYACDVTYCTNNELVFDYLRDRIALKQQSGRLQLHIARLALAPSRRPQLLLRGLHFALVDEADSVMIDEARTPLIISEPASDGAEGGGDYQAAWSAAAALEPGIDFTIDGRERLIHLTESGRARCVVSFQSHASLVNSWRRDELVCQALTALHLMHRDTHYLLKDGKIQIIDENTGRIMADRSWEHSLHQLIEIKEGCAITAPNDPLSRISYQHFFRRYRRLAGMTGTAREVRGELWSVYGLAVVRVPTHHAPRRVHLGDRVYPTAEAKWQAVVARVIELRTGQRPILIGTKSVAASESCSKLLSAAGVPHQVLNARQDEAEAAVIAGAGARGQITVATNMAGRGTDIRLGPGVAELGGLHVIGTEPHDSRRVDRQLWGRCGRQGEPGSYEMIFSLEDEIVRMHGGILRRWMTGTLSPCQRVHPRLGNLALRWAQCAAERFNGCKRRDLLRLDEQLQGALAFSGQLE
jgi:preprotein translocase subunit SecA